MKKSQYPSVEALRTMLNSSNAQPTLRAQYLDVVHRYESECEARALELATEILQAPCGQSPAHRRVEWELGLIQTMIPLSGLFQTSQIMDANDSATNFQSCWPVIEFLEVVEQLEALGAPVLVDVIGSPGGRPKTGIYGIANVVFEMGSYAARLLEDECRRLKQWQQERISWGVEFDERRQAGKKVRREHLIDWIKRVPSPKYPPTERNEILQAALLGRSQRGPKQSGHLMQALSEWHGFWKFVT
jgi:hypothetical protein